jgi:transposase-like protein
MCGDDLRTACSRNEKSTVQKNSRILLSSPDTATEKKPPSRGLFTLRMMGFMSFQTAEDTLAGIEAIHMLRKQQVEISPAISDVEWINKLFGVAAEFIQ